MNAYEAQRLENIERNRRLIQDLGIRRKPSIESRSRPTKRQKPNNPPQPPSRTSSRLAAAQRKTYNEDAMSTTIRDKGPPRNKIKTEAEPPTQLPAEDIADIRSGWSAWTATAVTPTRTTDGTIHFADAAHFTPNKTPEEILREGAFGGTYFRRYHSRRLGVTVADDWRELPLSWTKGLRVAKYLTSDKYDTEVNKFRVSAGQSIEEWEAQGWNRVEFDVRGWFQWYCRFYMGRRCADDERQISRWAKCVGPTGRWRRALLRKYVALGVREVFDDGEDGEHTKDVSPVIHQTCHHWAFEVRQGVLDEFWRTGP